MGAGEKFLGGEESKDEDTIGQTTKPPTLNRRASTAKPTDPTKRSLCVFDAHTRRLFGLGSSPSISSASNITLQKGQRMVRLPDGAWGKRQPHSGQRI